MPIVAMGSADVASVTVLASQLPLQAVMLKFLGSIALARLLGFGIVGFVVIYLLLSLLS
jgi:high-affinity nickel permease